MSLTGISANRLELLQIAEAKLVLNDQLMKRGAEQRAARIEHNQADTDQDTDIEEEEA